MAPLLNEDLISFLPTSPTNGFATRDSIGASRLSDSPNGTANGLNGLQRVLPLSFGQSRFWFLGQLVEDKTTFNITFWAQLKGPLRFAKLDAAVKKLGARHEALRTCFIVDEDGQPKQGILEQSTLRLEYKKIKSREEVDDEYECLRRHVYEIEKGEMMRIRLLSLSPLVNFLLIGYHHINMDGISLEIALADLEAFYSSRSVSGTVLQYPDYAVRQKQAIEDGVMKKDEDFWREELRDLPGPLPILPFAANRVRPLLVHYDHNRVDSRLPASLSSQIRDVAIRHKVSVYHFYLAVYEVMLSRLLGTDDLCIGMADGSRTDPDTANSVGMYLNLLPLRVELKRGESFVEVMKNARKKAFAAMSHSRLPFDVILEITNTPRSPSYSPLFQAFINYRQSVKEKRTFAGCEGQGEEYSAGRTGYDFTLDILDDPDDSTLVMLSVQKGLYSDKDSKVLLNIYVQLLEAFSKAPTAAVGEPSLFSNEELDIAISRGRGPKIISEWPETLIQRVDEIAHQRPHTIALKDGTGVSMAYKQMACRINSIAAILRGSQVTRGSLVGTYIEPSADLICSILAIMRLGATYVPLDVRTPVSRLATIVNDCQPIVILVHRETRDTVDGLNTCCSIISLSTVADSTTELVPILTTASDVAVILYTSGTTGTPKGVKISHSALRNELEAFTKEYKIGAHVVLQQTAYSFDFSLEQIFTALCNGGTLVLVPRSKRGDPVEIARLILAEGVTYTAATPSEFLSWIQYGAVDLVRCTSWQLAVAGGEQYPFKLYQQFKSLGIPGLRLLNIYGPTEVTISSSKIELPDNLGDASQHIPAGYTLPNYSVYILDGNLKRLPTGMPGEVFISGAGVADGYLNNLQLNDGKFLDDQFVTEHAIRSGLSKMYRTGDKGFLRDDGALVILGRIDGDSQTKLRGIRIEMEEIESVILKAAGGNLTNAVVSTRGEPPTYLVAHVCFASNFSNEPKEQTRFLRRLRERLPLPQAMCPAVMFPLERLPLNTHGKLDRRALANLEAEADIPYETEGKNIELTSTEMQLRDTWKRIIPTEVLRFHAVGHDSDFFQVGGNSMLLVKLQAEIERDFHVHLPLAKLFEYSTLAKMTAQISSANISNGTRIDWDTETSLSGILPEKDSSPGRIVGLTGTSGFIGRKILNELLKSEAVQQVHCIAVRNRERLAGFLSHPKVVIHEGDLADANLGLQPDDFAALSRAVDLIIHNGADVSFMKAYHSLRAPNVESTKAIIRLAFPRLVPVHYISSVVVGRLIPDAEDFPEISVSKFPPPPEYNDSYGMTKWASEATLEKAHLATGLPVWVHRPSNVTGEGVPETDLMHNVIKYSRHMHAIPRTDRWVGVLDFVSVERVARGVVKEALLNPTGTSKGVTFRHHSSEMVVPVDDLREYFRVEGKESNVEAFKEVPLSRWVAQAKTQGMSGLLAAVLEAVEHSDDVTVFQKLVKS